MISVITVCYNAEKEIERTMRSVLNQTYHDLEYVIVDGLSKDKTVSIIKEIKDEYPNRKIHFLSEPDRGIYDAMNKGLRLANGEWVNMMNAGDTFADINVLQRIFQKGIPDGFSFLYSDVYKSTSFGDNFIVKMNCDNNERRVIHQGCIYKKELHNRIGYYVVTPMLIISDYLFFLQVPSNEIMKTDTIIAIYEGNGVSENGDWCIKQILCANVVYRYSNFSHLYINYFRWKIKHILPLKVREILRILQYKLCGYV